MAVRGPAQGQRKLRLGPAFPAPSIAPRNRRLRPGQRLHVLQPVRRRPDTQEHLIEADLVDCIVALPGQLFRSTQIPACLWFLSRARGNGEHRDRKGEILFIDARKMGHMVDRTRRDLSQEDIARVAGTYHAWRGEKGLDDYADLPGFCKSAALDEVRKHGHVLTPGRYVGAEPQPDDGEPFEEKMTRLAAQWRRQQAEARRLDAAIEANLQRLGFVADQEDAR